jgi:hypothetical protein
MQWRCDVVFNNACLQQCVLTASSALTSSTLKWLYRIQCGFKVQVGVWIIKFTMYVAIHCLTWSLSSTNLLNLPFQRNSCFQMWTAIPKCEQLFPNVNSYSQMWTAIPKCEQLFPNVNQMWTAISKCEQLFPNVNSYFQMWTAVSKCEQLFPNVNHYFLMWPAISKCEQLYVNNYFRYVNSYLQTSQMYVAIRCQTAKSNGLIFITLARYLQKNIIKCSEVTSKFNYAK